MTKLLIVVAPLLVAACATAPAPEAPAPGKFVATQVQTTATPEFVLCRDESCEGRTQKLLPRAKPTAPKIAPIAKPAPAPAPVAVAAPRSFAVHFRLGRSRLDKAGAAELQPVIEHLRLQKSVKSIQILGRTDPTGTLKGNERLAVARAEEVKNRLIKAGIASALIDAKSHTPCCDGSLDANSAAMQARRRADIVIEVIYK